KRVPKRSCATVAPRDRWTAKTVTQAVTATHNQARVRPSRQPVSSRYATGCVRTVACASREDHSTAAARSSGSPCAGAPRGVGRWPPTLRHVLQGHGYMSALQLACVPICLVAVETGYTWAPIICDSPHASKSNGLEPRERLPVE